MEEWYKLWGQERIVAEGGGDNGGYRGGRDRGGGVRGGGDQEAGPSAKCSGVFRRLR